MLDFYLENNMRKNNLLILLLFLNILPVLGQEILSNRIYVFNLKTINPAFTAKDEGQNFTIMGTGTKSTFAYSPKPVAPLYSSSSIVYEKYFKKINSGIGVQYDNSNFPDTKAFSISYRYKIKLSKESTLSLGTTLKLSSIRRDSSYIDPASNALYAQPNAKPKIDGGLGMSYQYRNFYAGFSVNHINGYGYSIGPPYWYGYYYLARIYFKPILN